MRIAVEQGVNPAPQCPRALSMDDSQRANIFLQARLNVFWKQLAQFIRPKRVQIEHPIDRDFYWIRSLGILKLYYEIHG